MYEQGTVRSRESSGEKKRETIQQPAVANDLVMSYIEERKKSDKKPKSDARRKQFKHADSHRLMSLVVEEFALSGTNIGEADLVNLQTSMLNKTTSPD